MAFSYKTKRQEKNVFTRKIYGCMTPVKNETIR